MNPHTPPPHATASLPPLAPWRRALFVDVPYVLDSLWRWADFHVNQIGTIDLAAANKPFVRKAGWRTPSFVLYLLVSAFLAYGPTADALCTAVDASAYQSARSLFAVGLVSLAFFVFLKALNESSLKLAQELERLNELPAGTSAALAMAPSTAVPLKDRAVQNAFRFVSNCLRLPKELRRGRWLTFFTLFAGSLLVALPIAVLGLTLQAASERPLVCAVGTAAWRSWLQIGLLSAWFALGLWMWRTSSAGRSGLVRFVQVAIVWELGLALLWGIASMSPATEASEAPYPHMFALVIALLWLVALGARGLALRFVRTIPAPAQEHFRQALRQADLLNNDRDPPKDVGNLRILGSLINGLSSRALEFLLLPSLVAFMAPREYLHWAVAVFTLVSAMLLLFGNLTSRWEQMLILVERAFLVGTAKFVSLIVIAIALLRLSDVQYVTTVIDGTPAGVLFIVVVMLYGASWFFEYWINRWLAESLLGMLANDPEGCSHLAQSYQGSGGSGDGPRAEDRYIGTHGIGRFCVQGWSERHPKATSAQGASARADQHSEPGHFFTTYDFVGLFSALSAAAPSVDYLHDIDRRVRLYFNTINLCLLLIGVVAIVVSLGAANPMSAAPAAIVSSDALPGDRGGDLAAALTTRQGRPVLVVAASGGGTRAAVYAAMALRGIASTGHANDIALLSGVSGGGVAVATFASRFDSLSTTRPAPGADAQNDVWARYVAAMGEPFIQDVLEGIGEWRLAGSTRLGTLLQESLQRRIFANHADHFGDLHSTALILNSTMTGHPYDDSDLIATRVAVPPPASAATAAQGNCISTTKPFSSLSGGRIVFTNLRDVDGFPSRPEAANSGMPDLWLPYRVLRDPRMPLAAGSALTANFPPVFSSARVVITDASHGCDDSSYFVTDGGATENLGLVSALYGLKSALLKLPDHLQVQATAAPSPIHVVALEASAIDYDYSDDRGLGAVIGGAKERINAELTRSLLTELTALAAAKGTTLTMHFLPLPAAFRSRGGFGTHWRFAESIAVHNPLAVGVPGAIERWRYAFQRQPDSVDLDQAEVLTLWRKLFDTEQPFCAAYPARGDRRVVPLAGNDDVEQVSQWICGVDAGRRVANSDLQVESWQEFVCSLDAKPWCARETH